MHDSGELHLDAPAAWEPDLANGSLYFIGTATVLMRYGGFTILTDPNFLHAGDHVHLGYGLTSRRLTDPAMEIDELPPLDLCLLSHMHGDHFDRVAERKLDKNLPIITTPHAAADLRGKGFHAPYALDTWQSVVVHKGPARLRITSMPGRHAPGPLRFALPPVMGSMLEYQDASGTTALRLYITGDTLMHNRLHEIPQRYPNIDLMLLHLGGTRVLGVLVTMDAKQGVQAIQLIRPKRTVPIHYNDYTVFKSSLEDFRLEVLAAGLAEQVIYLAHGERYTFQIPASRWRAADRPLDNAAS